jgi:hypothetical protein
MRKVGSPARRYAVGGGAGNDALAESGAVPKQHTTQSHAPQRVRDAAADTLVRPRKHRQLMKWMDGRSRVVIRSKRESDPVIVITVDDQGGQP